MNNEQLAHDLAIAKLAGTDLPPDKVIEQYKNLKDEFLKYLSNEPKPQKTCNTKIISSPI